jgi:hypothetical protein
LIHWIGGAAVGTTIVLPRALALLDAREAGAGFEAFAAFRSLVGSSR